MKNTFLLTFALILLAGSPLKAQEKEEAATLNKVVNTLKERITLASVCARSVFPEPVGPSMRILLF